MRALKVCFHRGAQSQNQDIFSALQSATFETASTAASVTTRPEMILDARSGTKPNVPFTKFMQGDNPSDLIRIMAESSGDSKVVVITLCEEMARAVSNAGHHVITPFLPEQGQFLPSRHVVRPDAASLRCALMTIDHAVK